MKKDFPNIDWWHLIRPWLSAFIVAALLVMAAGEARATLIVHIERISDTKGILSGSGALEDPGGSRNVITLEDPFAFAPPQTTNVSVLGATTLEIGGKSIAFAYTLGGGGSLSWFSNGQASIYFGSSTGIFSGHAGISGVMEIVLPAAGHALAPVGSMGDIYWGQGDHRMDW